MCQWNSHSASQSVRIKKDVPGFGIYHAKPSPFSVLLIKAMVVATKKSKKQAKKQASVVVAQYKINTKFCYKMKCPSRYQTGNLKGFVCWNLFYCHSTFPLWISRWLYIFPPSLLSKHWWDLHFWLCPSSQPATKLILKPSPIEAGWQQNLCSTASCTRRSGSMKTGFHTSCTPHTPTVDTSYGDKVRKGEGAGEIRMRQ